VRRRTHWLNIADAKDAAAAGVGSDCWGPNNYKAATRRDVWWLSAYQKHLTLTTDLICILFIVRAAIVDGLFKQCSKTIKHL